MGENMVSNCTIDAVTGSAARTMDKRASHRPIGRRRLARYSQIRMTRMTSANLLGEQAEQAAKMAQQMKPGEGGKLDVLEAKKAAKDAE